MRLVLRDGVRAEAIGDEAVALDRRGSLVHHVAGVGAEALLLARDGVRAVDVPERLARAMSTLVDAGVVVTADWSRRRLLKAAGASAIGATLISTALASPAAAASGTVSGVAMVKSLNGNNTPDPPLPILCVTGGTGNSGRGSCVFTRTETPATITVTITLSTGTSAVGRSVYILQSVGQGGGCVGGTLLSVGVWAASPALGPQTFSAPIVGNADSFVITLQLSGGGGVDGWSSLPTLLG